ncbi:hypothetical protein BDQ17DRAFT_1325641 [Cyathus striatus]|nr:hypothetical protein BDQ17DRAFT_1325641 [Cyathus striatus]
MAVVVHSRTAIAKRNENRIKWSALSDTEAVKLVRYNVVITISNVSNHPHISCHKGWEREMAGEGDGRRGRWQEMAQGRWWEREMVGEGDGGRGRWWEREMAGEGDSGRGRRREREMAGEEDGMRGRQHEMALRETAGEGDGTRWHEGDGTRGRWWEREMYCWPNATHHLKVKGKEGSGRRGGKGGSAGRGTCQLDIPACDITHVNCWERGGDMREKGGEGRNGKLVTCEMRGGCIAGIDTTLVSHQTRGETWGRRDEMVLLVTCKTRQRKKGREVGRGVRRHSSFEDKGASVTWKMRQGSESLRLSMDHDHTPSLTTAFHVSSAVKRRGRGCTMIIKGSVKCHSLLFLYSVMNQYKFSNVAEDLKSRNMLKVVEPTFIADDLQATFYEIGDQVMVCWGGHWRAAELVCIEHMVHWRGCWKAVELVHDERQGKPKQKSAKKGNSCKSKVKEMVCFYICTGKMYRSCRVVSWYNICYPSVRKKKNCKV